MLVLEVFEVAVLVEIVFFDRRVTTAENIYLELYLALVAFTTLLQMMGVLLVVKGRYRLGGALQIAASSPHVLKGEGLIGVVGGLKARARGRAAAALRGADVL